MTTNWYSKQRTAAASQNNINITNKLVNKCSSTANGGKFVVVVQLQATVVSFVSIFTAYCTQHTAQLHWNSFHTYYSAPSRGLWWVFCLREYLQKYMSNLHQFLCMLAIATTRSSSGGVVISYVLHVLWMMSCLHTTAMKKGVYSND